jgi:dimethylglycine catabolism B
MSLRLPLLDAREAETRLCTYCPKLCRPACPVGDAEAREATIPWGIMRGLDELARGVVPPEAEADVAATAWACTRCGNCRTLCLLDNPVAETIADGRADAFAAGLAPDAARGVSERFPARIERIEAAAEALGEATVSRGDGTTAYLPGCTAVLFEADSVDPAARAVARLSPSGGCTVVSDFCCGAPLLDAGDREGFLKHARRVAADLGAYAHLVTGDAGCAHTLKILYAQLGVAPSRWTQVEHIAELAARNTHRLTRVDEPREVVVHDACRLGRGMGVYDAPRAVISAVSGRAPTELPSHHEKSRCSGAGALLPVTRPETAKALAHTLADEVREVTGGRDAVVVTSCAASRRALRSAGIEAEDLSLWIARGLSR